MSRGVEFFFLSRPLLPLTLSHFFPFFSSLQEALGPPARQLQPCRTGSLNVRFPSEHPGALFRVQLEKDQRARARRSGADRKAPLSLIEAAVVVGPAVANHQLASSSLAVPPLAPLTVRFWALKDPQWSF